MFFLKYICTILWSLDFGVGVYGIYHSRCRIGRMGCAFFDPEFESGAFKNVSPIICRCIISAKFKKKNRATAPPASNLPFTVNLVLE